MCLDVLILLSYLLWITYGKVLISFFCMVAYSFAQTTCLKDCLIALKDLGTYVEKLWPYMNNFASSFSALSSNSVFLSYVGITLFLFSKMYMNIWKNKWWIIESSFFYHFEYSGFFGYSLPRNNIFEVSHDYSLNLYYFRKHYCDLQRSHDKHKISLHLYIFVKYLPKNF